MIIGIGRSTKLIWFTDMYVSKNKLTFIFKSASSHKKITLNLEPKDVNSLWVYDNAKTPDVKSFIEDVFNVHFNNSPITIKYPQAFGVCIRIKRKLQLEYANVVI